MLRISNSLEVPKKPDCGACNDVQAQEITDALLSSISYDDVGRLCDNRLSVSTLQRHKKHVENSIKAIPTKPKEATNYPLADPSLSSDAVRMLALEEMIKSAARLRDMCLAATVPNPKAEEAYLRALSQIESVSVKLKFN